jgi:hypothetical protein
MVKDRSQRAVTTPVSNHCATVTAGCTAASACSYDTEMGALGSGPRGGRLARPLGCRFGLLRDPAHEIQAIIDVIQLLRGASSSSKLFGASQEDTYREIDPLLRARHRFHDGAQFCTLDQPVQDC